MGVDLDDILAREGLGRAHGTKHNLIQNFLILRVNDMAVVERVAFYFAQIFPFEDFLGNSKAVSPA